MSNIQIYVLIVHLIISVSVGISVNKEQKAELKSVMNPSGHSGRSRYSSYMSLYGKWMPFTLLIFLILFPLAKGKSGMLSLAAIRIFPLAISTSIYYTVMLMLMPFLRKYIKARTRSTIWFVPTLLFFFLLNDNLLVFPKVFFRVSETMLWIFIIIWSIGFLCIFLWNIVQHMRYRRYILEDAVYITDEEILNVWEAEQLRVNLKKHIYDLAVSKNVKTPLSIGLFPSTIAVVLPEGTYTLEELTLIFRHEAVHISREDAWSKFFMMFCTALNWYNPLMWIAMRKCKEEIELSCDETVLLGADDSVRKEYARLLLNTAGCEKAFTTCLSAAAHAMKYRLENIMKTRTLYSCGIAAGIFTFVLFMSMGVFGLSLGFVKGEEFIYGKKNTDNIEITRIENIRPNGKSYDCIDEEAFHTYLKALSGELRFDGTRSPAASENCYFVEFDVQGRLEYICLWDYMIQCDFGELNEDTSTYYIPEGIDWTYLNTLLKEKE